MMDAAEKAEWIEERAAIIQEGNGDMGPGGRHVADMLARRCWEDTFGDPQKRLF